MKSKKKSIAEVLGREPVHPFPARMAPELALQFLARRKRSLRVLDPMMGSGTVIALARSEGHKALGVDVDPLAVLMSTVWASVIEPEKVCRRGEEVLARARRSFKKLKARDAYPRNADLATRKFIVYWFDSYARRQLAALSSAIARVRDKKTRDALWCAFSRLIITKQSGASLAMDLSHSRPHKSFERAPTKPFTKFSSAVERVVESCLNKKSPSRGPAPTLATGDARKLKVRKSSVDLVLTSPPYLNAIDYMRCSKFSLVWMGYSVNQLTKLRSRSVGAEAGDRVALADPTNQKIISRLRLRPRLTEQREAVLARYIDDIRAAMDEVARVLVPGGQAIYVVGENTVRGTYIRNAEIVAAAASLSGLRLRRSRSRRLPDNRRYLPPPVARKSGKSNDLHARMRREVILTFGKPKPRRQSLERRRRFAKARLAPLRRQRFASRPG